MTKKSSSRLERGKRNVDSWTIERFDKAVQALERSITIAVSLSRFVANRHVDVRRGWASVLFTRLCTASISFLNVVPRTSQTKQNPIENWDFSAAASMARNIIECCLFFYYFCIDEIDEDEWKARLWLMNLHDCSSRIKMFRDMGEMEETVQEFEKALPRLHRKLAETKYFSMLEEKQRKRFLTGDHAMFLIQDEILARLGEDPKHFRSMYRYMSAHTHTLPLSFHRMFDGDRGRGIETDYERSHIGGALLIVNDWLRRATLQMESIFPDAVGPHQPRSSQNRPKKSSRLLTGLMTRVSQ